MKSWPMLAPITAFSLLCAATASAHDQRGADEIMKLERDVAAAQTAPEIVSFYSDDVHQYDPIAKVEIFGKQALTANVTQQMAPIRSFVTTIVSLKADAEGDLGYAYSDQKVALTTKDGKSMDIHLWMTHILRKQGGVWKITHEQLSYLP